MSRRALIADAAISTLARDGMRGLTHRAVDRAAGLPEGSASYYFRTRQALLQATVERLAELTSTDLQPLPARPPSGARAATRRP
jgi:DNA-binding transcriptional regulator YbjK